MTPNAIATMGVKTTSPTFTKGASIQFELQSIRASATRLKMISTAAPIAASNLTTMLKSSATTRPS
jgi:hypothetical protein